MCWCSAVQVMADVASFTGAATVSLMLVSKYIFQVRGCSCVTEVDRHCLNPAVSWRCMCACAGLCIQLLQSADAHDVMFWLRFCQPLAI
jgi:hypothetical protein